MAAQWIRPLDWALADWIASEAGRLQQPCPPLLLLAMTLTSHQVGRGHVCLDLAATLRDPERVLDLPPDGDPTEGAGRGPAQWLRGLTLPAWIEAIDQPWVVGSVGDSTPLIRRGPLLYLRRYWNHEQQILAGIQHRLAHPPAVDEQALSQVLARLFPRTAARPDVDWQQVACALAARESFAVLTGGPGTGKTTTVVKLLATLQVLAEQQHGAPLRIRLAAPTGKAAARLNESIRRQTGQFEHWFGADQATALVQTILAEKVSTVHRLLGTLPAGQGFRHHRWNRLAVDVVVVDEASMVDIHLLSCLVDALPETTRLILLGDKDQLASVEAGAVLGQLCARAEAGNYWATTAAWLRRVAAIQLPAATLAAEARPDCSAGQGHGPWLPGLVFDHSSPASQRLDQAVTMLRRSHRFADTSGIGRLAKAVNAGDAQAAWQLLQQDQPDLQLINARQPQEPKLQQWIVEGYRPFLEQVASGPPDATAEAIDRWARQVLELQSGFQLLCTVRRGPWGVDRCNERIVTWLRRAQLIPSAGQWFPGRPVMVTRNNYGLRLMNGDLGVVLPSGPPLDTGGGLRTPLRVAFPDSESPSGLRWVLPSRLGDVETVFAMTVHKSQGSEFTRVGLLLPDRPSPVMTRELIYTGITRAAQHFSLVLSHPSVLRDAIQSKIQRTSGPLTDWDSPDDGVPT
jgi:exodeoxyribonuclease V alpha subunit